ncbi:hypothetical protein [Jannaschia aquimarina]|uniref:Uncharacterized protein n=1 Tax=Jannaschia aquimarina TaxID=935700 RepID=A0A0D1CKF3_9RHOB|nr:hypothetical protein [Jannaschia aquimarina]KIT15227.1 hypothetical protein jaqu_30500 [Jannaschia aquimarina]SNT32631.1 hypothetical protein SAMN05421775_11176 [Jannaschia aquimarina]
MTSEYSRMATVALRGYVAAIGATAETGERALRAAAGEAADIAKAAAGVIRAPEAEKGLAAELAMRVALEAQRSYLHGLRGATSLWTMAYLERFDPDPRDRDGG